MTKATKFTVRQPKEAANSPPAKPAAPPEAAARATTGDVEFGGPQGKEPTRYGDWEKNGRCSDF